MHGETRLRMRVIGMFDYEQPPPERKEVTDYTGLITLALVAPLFFLFVYLGKAELGFTVCLVLGVNIIAVRLRWRLRKHVWFWAAIAFILLLHIPLLFIVRWPKSNVPTIAYSLPLGILDFLLISGAIGLAQKAFSKDSSSDGEDE
jgi:hypothetical protein